MNRQYNLYYSLRDDANRELAGGEAKADLVGEQVRIFPEYGNLLVIPLGDISHILDEDYKIYLYLSSSKKLVLYYLGRDFEEYLNMLFKAYNEFNIEHLLMKEAFIKSFRDAYFERYDDSEKEMQAGSCELHIYETALILIPKNSSIERLPYSFISKVSQEDYKVYITLETGERFVLSKIGRQLDAFVSCLSTAMNNISLKTQEVLKELFPNGDLNAIACAANLMKEGRAAAKEDIDLISPALWPQIEEKINAAGMGEEYEFLKSLGDEKKIYIGIKRGLMGDLTGEYCWFLIPVYSLDPNKPGNAIVMEAATNEGAARATYFFRIFSRRDYASLRSMENIDARVDKSLKMLNYCMNMVNFRREPIYLPDSKLDTPTYSKYRYAIDRLSHLRELRNLFIGRVLHNSWEQWKLDTMDILKFNVSTLDDSVKWEKQRR